MEGVKRGLLCALESFPTTKEPDVLICPANIIATKVFHFFEMRLKGPLHKFPLSGSEPMTYYRGCPDAISNLRIIGGLTFDLGTLVDYTAVVKGRYRYKADLNLYIAGAFPPSSRYFDWLCATLVAARGFIQSAFIFLQEFKE